MVDYYIVLIVATATCEYEDDNSKRQSLIIVI
jgi:hypothetical protein